MNYREQCFKNCAQALGYLDNSDIANISNSNIKIEEYLGKEKPIAQAQLNYLKLLFVKYIFLSVANKLSAIPQQQVDEIVRIDIDNIKKNIHPQFGSAEQKIVQHPAFQQILGQMKQILTGDEMKMLEFMWGKSQSIPVQQVTSAGTRQGVSTSGDGGPKDFQGIPAVLGDYRIIEVIGAGGMGKVFKAYHQNLEREVAIKVMLSQTEIARKRFLVEAKLTAKMQHPNIIPIHDIKSEGRLDYIVMDFIQGKPLSSILEEKKPSLEQTLKVMTAIISAVAYAHRYQVIHRDLKPSNILVENETLRPIVMDFGLAKQMDNAGDDNITKPGQILGSPRYMAPEQANAEEIDHRADIYALGAIFYEMLTGKSAIEGGGLVNIIYQITQPKYPHPREVDPTIPSQIENICLKAMALEREKRYQTADEFLAEIERVAISPSSTEVKNNNKKIENKPRKSIQARRSSAMRMTQRQQRQPQKNNKTMIFALTGFACFALVTILYLMSGNNKSSENTQKEKQEIVEKEQEIIQKQLDLIERENELLAKQVEEEKRKREEEQRKLEEMALKEQKEQEENYIDLLKKIANYERKRGYIEIEFFDITPAIKNIRKEKEKIYLVFRGLPIKNDDLKPIVNMHNVVGLDLTGAKDIDDNVFDYIATLKNLRVLDLEKSGVSAAGLGKIAHLRLQEIDLDYTTVNDENVHFLKNIYHDRLKEIQLEGTDIGDESMKILLSFTNLEKLKIKNTKITMPGHLKLQHDLRKCSIEYW